MWLRVYESLRTCVVHIDPVGDPLQGSTTYAHPSYLLLNALDILLRNSVGYLCSTWRRRTWTSEPSRTVTLRSWVMTDKSDAPFSPDMFPANTMAYDNLNDGAP